MRTIQRELVDKGFADVLKHGIEQKNSRTSKLVKERLTRREIEELMECNRDTYKRVRGTVKRR